LNIAVRNISHFVARTKLVAMQPRVFVDRRFDGRGDEVDALREIWAKVYALKVTSRGENHHVTSTLNDFDRFDAAIEEPCWRQEQCLQQIKCPNLNEMT
jgi:hypothetical protein